MTRIVRFSILLAALAAWPPDGVRAQDPTKGTGLPLPRFVSLRATEVNMRAGPGVRYPVDWVYRRRNLPVEVIAEFGTWRQVRDVQGTQGWVHQSMLSNRRMISVTGQRRSLRQKANSDSPAVAELEAGVVGALLACPEGSGWCKMEFGEVSGWLRRVEFWGTYPGENVR